ncbi:MAG: glycoside hydrolase family 125 protein [Chloroflexi bacterium]|nr:glycoside hydrolase family 125 protein [Chloroflexota bacterium]
MALFENTFTTTSLLPVLNKKPLDLGCGRLSASISANGEILSLNGYHPRVGFMTLAPIAQFPDDQFYNSTFVRQYRRRLIEIFETRGHGFGMRPRGNIQDQTLHLVENSMPLVRYHLDTLAVSSLFLAVDVEHYGCLINQVEIHNAGEEEAIFAYEFGGTLSMNRASYGQITEAGPIPMSPLENALVVKDNHLSITNRYLPARADVLLFDGNHPLLLSPATKTTAAPADYTHTGYLSLGKGETRVITIIYILTPVEEEPFTPSASQAEEWARKAMNLLPKWQVGNAETTGFIIQRNLDYILSCCAIPVTDEHVCVITDHQVLPLSWNRDVYYMLQLLFVAERQVASLIEDSQQSAWMKKVRHLLRAHILWTFETAQRPHRYWGRAYLTTGYCKDDVFQLDQQCYPLLELCDYFTGFRDADLVRRVAPQVNEILAMLMDYKDEQKWLFMTGETPGDDHVVHPYHFSSQVLVWWTLCQLASLNSSVPFTTQDLSTWAEHVRQDCLASFTASHGNTTLFAYLTDLQGNYQFYHDANDLPTVYAPLWGFCQQDDAAWQQTLLFGLSTQNKGGFYPGAFGGLGSVHTPHPWPLGDGQELLYAHILHDLKRYEQVLQKLMRVVQWDGLFSEAIHEETGRVTSRHWFSWPGAFISTVLLNISR